MRRKIIICTNIENNNSLANAGLFYNAYACLALKSPTASAENYINNSTIASLCYYYKYDSCKRMVEKKIPSADPVYMVYYRCDRLVLSQDSQLRKNNDWMYTQMAPRQ